MYRWLPEAHGHVKVGRVSEEMQVSVRRRKGDQGGGQAANSAYCRHSPIVPRTRSGAR
jgi:hypothetical protein